MSLLTLPLQKDEYLGHALTDFLAGPPASRLGRSHHAREGEYLVRELVDGIDLHVAGLETLHERADEMTDDEWSRHQQRLQRSLLAVIDKARQVLGREDLRLVGTDRLHQRIRDVEHDVLWSVSDEADTPAFARMAAESERAYAAGEWDEGGWDD